ncbi:MAG: acetyl-CoA carboxylase biotin carboxyl carrier protein [Clostridiales bacterium]|nr:acetyl-CoA carboxylase biotin carboxyl carrier protein [Clostridiales bacterium]
MEFSNVLELIDRVSNSKLTAFSYEGEGVSIRMRTESKEVMVVKEADTAKHIAVPENQEKATDAKQAATSCEAPESKTVVKSPLVGTFYAAAAEDAPPFVKVGDTVKRGQVLGIVEAMKLMNEIESDYEGVITEILVENAQAVEYGQPLFRIG